MRFTGSILTRFQDQLILHEGLRLKSYLDTVGKWTIGVGRNISDRPFSDAERFYLHLPADGRVILPKLVITRDQALFLLDNDIQMVCDQIEASFPWIIEQDVIRQRVLADMCFNMGINTLRTFTGTLGAFHNKDYRKAKRNMLRSKWANQVGDGEGGKWDRAERLAEMTLTGKDYIK